MSVERIKEEVSVPEAMGRLGVPIPEAHGRVIYLVCPFHEDKTPSAWIPAKLDRFHCFTCDEGGDVIWVVQRLRECGFKDALEWLHREFGISDDPYEEMHSQFVRRAGSRVRRREARVDCVQAFLDMEHARYWRMVDEHPDRKSELRALQNQLLLAFQADQARQWYQQALEALDRCVSP